MSIRNLCPSEDLKESLGELNLRWKNLFVGNIYATGIEVDDDIDADVINVNHLYVNYINDFEISQTPKPNTIVVSRSDGTIHPDWYTVFATSTAISALRYTGHTRTSAALYGGNTNPINLTRLNYDGSFYATRLQVTGDTRNPGFLYTGNQDPTNTTERLNYDGKFYATQFTATGTIREPGFFYTGNVDPISDHRLNYDGNLHMSRLRVTGTTKTAGMFYAGTDNPSNINRTNYDGYFYATQLYDDATRVVNYNRNIIAGNGLTGGGTLAADRTITLGTPSDITGTSTNSVTATSHTHKFDTTTLAIYSVLATSTETSVLRYTGHTKTSAALYGGTTAPSNTTRLNYDGYLYATRVYNAVYNDYAECFENNSLIYNDVKNRIVCLNDKGQLELAKFMSNNVIGIVSDNYGMLLGGSEEDVLNNKKIPVGLVGTLYVDCETVVDETHLFSFICSGNNGKAKVIPHGEAYKYEGCVVGKIIGLDIKNNRYKVLLCLH